MRALLSRGFGASGLTREMRVEWCTPDGTGSALLPLGSLSGSELGPGLHGTWGTAVDEDGAANKHGWLH